ncbi:MAG: polyhydroxyalkanoate synthesis repressor PhaR, partial [Pseudomonadota bacterium]|nr:polyhydroxyalkanoate synthesis repressor PhaR [Pseudomonadota bacterium]
LPHYLEYSIDAFSKNQEEIQNYMQDTFGNMFSVGQLEQMGKQNVAMFEQAMRMFTPFDSGKATEQTKPVGPKSEQPAAVQSLQDQLNALQAQLNKMSGDG